MARIERLREQIVDFLIANRKSILMTQQSQYCGPCGGMKITDVYRNPDSGQIGVWLDQYERETNTRTT